MDLDFEDVWVLGLVLGAASALAAFIAAKLSTTQAAQRRRLLFALAAILAFGTAIPVALTGAFFFLFSGYCEDVGYCSPDWWVYVGLSLLGAAIVLVVLMERAIRGYRRVG